MSKERYYLTTAPDPNEPGRMMAVISLGSPQLGDDPVTICDVKSVADQEEARRWFDQQLETRPWEARQ